jgi:pimeloyl-ACP methyl ester carboxylesterase
MEPVTIIAHSLGGSIALLYSGIFPETVKKVVAIEGLGPPPQMRERTKDMKIEERMRTWIAARRESAGRSPRKYATLEDAIARMKEENKHLNAGQARHLTIHGAVQNEDGTYSWKFDNFVRMGGGPAGLSHADQHRIWNAITSPVLLVRGAESWASDPAEDGRIKHFKDARRVNIARAGHWSHHDQLDVFMKHVEAFLGEA